MVVIAASNRRVCPAVSLGPDGPHVTVLKSVLRFADDLVILAEDGVSLQRALDAAAVWAYPPGGP